jgi:hypothetical protein
MHERLVFVIYRYQVQGVGRIQILFVVSYDTNKF